MKRNIDDLYDDMFYEMTMNGIYDTNYLDDEYFYDKWKKELDEYNNNNLDNEVWKDIPNY